MTPCSLWRSRTPLGRSSANCRVRSATAYPSRPLTAWCASAVATQRNITRRSSCSRCSRGRLQTKDLPTLPIPLANGAGALSRRNHHGLRWLGATRREAALNRLFAFDLKAARPQWRELEPCPGKPRILAGRGDRGRSVLHRGRRGVGSDQWPDGPRVSARCVAVSAVQRLASPRMICPTRPSPRRRPRRSIASQFFIIGGDDGSLARFQPHREAPWLSEDRAELRCASQLVDARTAKCPPRARRCRPRSGRVVGCCPAARSRPGVRSPEVWALQIR